MLGDMLAPLSLAALSGIPQLGQPLGIPVRSVGQAPTQPAPASLAPPAPASSAPDRTLPRGSLLDLTV